MTTSNPNLSKLGIIILLFTSLMVVATTTHAIQSLANRLTGIECSVLDKISPNCLNFIHGEFEDVVPTGFTFKILDPNFTKFEYGKYSSGTTVDPLSVPANRDQLLAQFPAGQHTPSTNECRWTSKSGKKYKSGFTKDSSDGADGIASSYGGSTLKHAYIKRSFSNGACNYTEIVPDFSASPSSFTNYNNAQINIDWYIRYSGDGVVGLTRVKIVDDAEPFIYYK